MKRSLGRGRWRRWRQVLTGVYIVAAIAGFYNYIDWLSAPTVVGALALLYAPVFGKHPPESFRFGWGALFFMGLYFLLPVMTTLYLAWCCAACLLLETFHRRVGTTLPLILLLLTPVASYFVDTFSFPIRLQLANIAARLIGSAGAPIAVKGSSITFHDRAFSVDPACVGLHMLLVSLLAGLLLVNYYQSHYQRRLRIVPVLILLTLISGLNILANAFRIICLILFSILPGHPLHDIIGLLFLLGYILLPVCWLVRYTIRRFGVPVTPEETVQPRPARRNTLLAGNIGIAGTLILLVVLSFRTEKAHPARYNVVGKIEDYKIKEVEGSVLQLDNKRSLVYIKPIAGFYYTDHTPTICWQGSGYTFSAVQETTIAGVTIFEGILEYNQAAAPTPPRDTQRLYTAWWYDDGIRQTIQPDWRWDLIRGGPAYSVINVTAASRGDLQAELTQIFQTHPFSPLLGQRPSPARVKIW